MCFRRKKFMGPPKDFGDNDPVKSAMEIQNWIDVLPWHKTRRWDKREMSDIKNLIVHQAANEGSLKAINKYHITPSPDNHISSKGTPHLCYHYAIDREGAIYKTNPLTDIVWHAGDKNKSSIGVLALGNFSGPSYIGSQEPTGAQIDSLAALLDAVVNNDEIVLTKKDIFGHKDFGKENCPGSLIYSFLEDYKS